MRKCNILWLLPAVAMVCAGCSSNTYSRLRAEEDKIIANYLSRNRITVLKELPGDGEWREKDYYKVSGYDNFYFHLISRGDSVRVDEDGVTQDLSVIANDLIVVRYKQFELTENADTLSYWTTLDEAYPYEFHYGNTGDCEAVAWHEAVRLMKYPDSQCEIIVPSKQGFNADQMSVTPYGYIMKIKVKRQ